MMSTLWRILASPRTSALLAILVAVTSIAAALIPQGPEALALARDAHATEIHQLASWGLTGIYGSFWFRALMALVLGNLLAVLVTAAASGRTRVALDPPKSPPMGFTVKAPRPESAVEIARALLGDSLGPPVAEDASGARARMVFDVGRSGRLAPALSHAGLMALVLGSSLYAHTDANSKIPRAVVDITDQRSRASGRFDIVAGEPFKFFQSPVRYTLREYLPSREGLGPAVRFERQPEGEPPRDFWVYARAPAGFDGRHREGDVAIEARWLGNAPKPGKGIAASGFSSAMAGGLALIGLGLGAGRRPRGRLWAVVEGDEIVLAAVPESARDPAFAAAMERVVRELNAALNET